MPKEPEFCRDLMEDILKFTGGRRRLSVSEVARFEGRDRRTVQRCYQIDPKKGIDALVLAKKMCQ
ncbi:MAG: hypothetical protein E7420_08720 [Ruminococcaceae bacterium]|nr:hypothetical protein [Oscillospiraceae bacterium]